MKYLCLAYYDVTAYEAMPKAQFAAIASQCPAHDRKLHASGQLRSVASLAAPSQATSIRPKNGKPVVYDGPFMETKEQLGSFFIIEAKDAQEAVRIASLHPAALLGEQVGWGIEVRAIEFYKDS